MNKKYAAITPEEYQQINQAPSLICPYIPKHKVRPTKFASHVQKCQKQHSQKFLSRFATCKYNSMHIFSRYQIAIHEKNCPNKDKMIDLEEKLTGERVMVEEVTEDGDNEDRISRKSGKSSKTRGFTKHKDIQFFLNDSTLKQQNKEEIKKFQQPVWPQQNKYFIDFDKNYESQSSFTMNNNQMEQKIKKLKQYNRKDDHDFDKFFEIYDKQNIKKQQKSQTQYKQQESTVIYSRKEEQKDCLWERSQCSLKSLQSKQKIPTIQKQSKFKLNFNFDEPVFKDSANSKNMRSEQPNKVDDNKLLDSQQFKVPNPQKHGKQQKKKIKNKNTNNFEQQGQKQQNILLNQCKKCTQILSNVQIQPWKNKKLIKMLKAYQKLQQQQQKIKIYLKNIPMSLLGNSAPVFPQQNILKLLQKPQKQIIFQEQKDKKAKNDDRSKHNYNRKSSKMKNDYRSSDKPWQSNPKSQIMLSQNDSILQFPEEISRQQRDHCYRRRQKTQKNGQNKNRGKDRHAKNISSKDSTRMKNSKSRPINLDSPNL